MPVYRRKALPWEFTLVSKDNKKLPKLSSYLLQESKHLLLQQWLDAFLHHNKL